MVSVADPLVFAVGCMLEVYFEMHFLLLKSWVS